jgi:hypothetical protein
MPESPCPSCKSTNVFRTRKPISSGGGYAPNLLPGVSNVFGSRYVRVVVCGDCGLLRQFVDREALQKLRQAKQWERV